MDYGEIQMISTTINNVLNEQINKEFYSGYLYLSISAHMQKLGLSGFASWLKHQAKEEVEHGLKIFDYLLECNSFVTLKQIRIPEFEYKNVVDIFNMIYEHEQSVTRSVINVIKFAEEESDRLTLNFMEWFIQEQVQEEEAIKHIVKRLELFGAENSSLFLMDKELGERS